MTTVTAKIRYLLSRREQRHTAGLLLLLAFGAALEIVGVGAIPAFVAVLGNPRLLLQHSPAWARGLIPSTASDATLVVYAALGLLAISVVKNGFIGIIAYVQNRYAMRHQSLIAQRLLRAYLRAPYAFHLERNTAELLRNANEAALGIVGTSIQPILALVLEGLTIVAIVGLLVAREPEVSVVALTLLGGVSLAFIRAVRGRLASYGDEMHIRRVEAIRVVNEGLGGVKIMKVLGREQTVIDRYARVTSRYAQVGLYRATVADLPRLYLESTALLGVLAVAGILLLQHRPTYALVPVLSLFAVAVVRMIPSFNRVTGAVTTLRYGQQDLNAVYDDLRQLEGPDTGHEGTRSSTGLHFAQHIEFEDVTFRYATAPNSALARVNLRIRKGTAVGIVGPTGSGKTTFVDLLLGLLEPTAGRILVDGTDIRDDMRAWQNRIGYVPQDTYLTDDSIRHNIALGLPDDEIDAGAVARAVAAAQLTDFVASLPAGLDTHVGERGVRLSGGQRQRIGIARALYSDPEVLVMDEATSSLDGQTERYVMEAVESLRQSRTILLIAHRMTTVRSCDTLVMLSDGGISDTGTYAELMAGNQRFRSMVAVDSVTSGSDGRRPTAVVH